jgi:hypothetical protein
MRNSSEPSPVQIIIDQKRLENVKYINYLGSMIINNARYMRAIKSRTATAKEAFSRKKTFFTSKFDLNLRKKLVKNCISNTAFMVLKLGQFGKQIGNS